MDLDDFDAALAALPLDDEPIVQSQDAKEAVAYIDREWYTLVNRRGRWMDLIGDYAGSEPFVVDGMYSYPLECVGCVLRLLTYKGEALVQLVLDDPLLALGREDGA